MARAESMSVNKSFWYWRGALGVLAGVLVLVWPKETVLVLVTLVSIWLLLTGVVTIIEGVSNVKNGGGSWVASVLVGVLELGVGAYLLQRPNLTTLTIITLLGLVFVVQGVVHFVRAFADPGISGNHRLLNLLVAVLSVAAGIWIWRYPYHGTLAFVWLLGLYLIVSGGLLIAMGSQTEE